MEKSPSPATQTATVKPTEEQIVVGRKIAVAITEIENYSKGIEEDLKDGNFDKSDVLDAVWKSPSLVSGISGIVTNARKLKKMPKEVRSEIYRNVISPIIGGEIEGSETKIEATINYANTLFGMAEKAISQTRKLAKIYKS